jgi:hypothetical protein
MAKLKARDLRRLSLALAMSSPSAQTVGLLLGLMICAIVGGGLVAFKVAGGPAAPVYGAIVGLGFAETDFGSRPYANVSVDDRFARVTLARGSLCRTGDRIALHRRKAPWGYRYMIAPSGCGRP